MNVLIIGGGGREHALAWKAAQSYRVDTVFVAPGNGGTAREPGVENVAIDVMDFEQLAQFARDNAVGRSQFKVQVRPIDAEFDLIAYMPETS